jgi:hypothetical protein
VTISITVKEQILQGLLKSPTLWWPAATFKEMENEKMEKLGLSLVAKAGGLQSPLNTFI